ncbi:hypothetical protein CPC08DRAFT_737848 [Agrocybe pediades]|nr:hypothetical protein CPC08DRAFT_737848 [Agrocybe pediades]
MGWLSSLFFSDNSQRNRNGQVFSSTHEAFSLPTSSPVFPSHPDAFNPSTLNTPDPDSARTPASYTYPPTGPMSYGYIPSSSGFNSRPGSASLLPTHMDPMHRPLAPGTSYPPLSKTWARIRAWLNREYPELGDTLNYGILPQDLAQIEMQFGFALPSVVRESYLCVDGQEAESAAGCSEGLFFGLTLLPLESVLEEWRFWREVDKDPNTGANEALRRTMQSLPPGWIRTEYSQRGWIPLIADKAGNYLGVDLNPGEQGTIGQVIVFGRDFDTKVVMWPGDGPTGWAKWLASFVEELESGDGFEIGATDASEGSEDELGYESYYYDGNGRGQGDGGGDIGSGGGLRYTGEYRGWNVLEVWADRSLRKWQELGVIPDAALLPDQDGYNKEAQQDLDIVELTMQGPGAAEVPIPVLKSSSEAIPPPTVEALRPQAGPSKQYLEPVPTISVTKPPAPRPVVLPTALDIAPLSSPPGSGHSSTDDIESGRINGEFAEDISLVTETRLTGRSKPPVRRDTSEANGSALPISPPLPPLPASPSPSSSSNPPQIITTPPTDVPDLLSELSPVVSQQSFAPLSAPSSSNAAEESSSSAVVNASVEPEPEVEPEVTVKLIGGGGQSGVSENLISTSPIEETPEVPPAPKENDVISLTSVTSSDTGSNKEEKTHKKSKSSLASFKRISQLGKKKTGSVTSLQEAVLPPVQ